jgi:hypothetical protein
MKQIGRPSIDGAKRDKWIHLRVTEEKHRKIIAAGGYQFLRAVIDEQLSTQPEPTRLEDVWGKQA